MILKNADNKEAGLEQLDLLASNASDGIYKKTIENEIRQIKSGIKAEKEVAYLIDFDLKASKNSIVLHDLRLELQDRTAQIDHLILNRTLNFFVIETKSFHAGIKINESGEFLQWNAFKNKFEGIASPLEQNKRHISVLDDVIANIEMPTRLGFRLEPTYNSVVVLTNNARIDRPKHFETNNVIKSDSLTNYIKNKIDEDSLLAISKLVSIDTLSDIAQKILSFHKPITFNYSQKYAYTQNLSGNDKENLTKDAEKISVTSDRLTEDDHVCKTCNSNQLSIIYGKFGYYFKCKNCNANTAIKLTCGNSSHHEKIRKDGQSFYRECDSCGSSTFFYKNS